MKKNFLFKLTGASLVAMGLTFAPIPEITVQAQETGPDTEIFDAVEPDPQNRANPNLQQAEESLEQAGQEAVQSVEEAGAAAEQQINLSAQEAAQSAQEAAQTAQQTSQEAVESAEQAAQRAELAAENAIESAEQRSSWGWLGLFGLIGLFGLVGGNKRRVDTEDRYYRQPAPTPTTTGSASNEYRR